MALMMLMVVEVMINMHADIDGTDDIDGDVDGEGDAGKDSVCLYVSAN